MCEFKLSSLILDAGPKTMANIVINDSCHKIKFQTFGILTSWPLVL